MSATVTLQQLTDQLDALEQQAAAEIAEAVDAQSLEQLRVGLLGKKGRISAVLGAMGKLPGEERPVVGQRANVLKNQVQTLLSERLQAVKQAAMAARIAGETLDVTAPASGTPMGHRHPLISTTEEIVDLFLGLGYSVAEGPEVEQDHYNFTALNIPEDHPARDMQDTFYLKGDLLLRTHTSPVQIRHLQDNSPPVRIVAPGRVYRRDAVDATHSPVFHQVEVLAIDEGLDFSHLRGTVMAFLKAFFGDLPVRFRASYFPFTEPSAEVDVQWRGRCKSGNDRERLEEAKALRRLCRNHGALFVINDRIDLALAVDADGVHLGQDDLPTDVARGLIGEARLLGRSTNTLDDVRRADAEACDYLGLGPVHTTVVKPEKPAVGPVRLQEAKAITRLPVFAIGGIDLDNIAALLDVGCRRIAVIGAIMAAENPERATQQLLQALLPPVD